MAMKILKFSWITQNFQFPNIYNSFKYDYLIKQKYTIMSQYFQVNFLNFSILNLKLNWFYLFKQVYYFI